MKEFLDVIILEDNKDDLKLIKRELQKLDQKLKIRETRNKNEYTASLNENLPDIILSDFNLPDINGEEALMILRAKSKNIPFILVTGTIGEEKAVELIKNGASDFIMKDKIGRLVQSIEREINDYENNLIAKKDHEELAEKQNEIKFQKEFYDKIINAVASPIFVKDDKYKFTLVNNALCSLLNLPKEELIGKTGYEYFPEEQNDVFLAKDKEVFENGKENISEEFITDGTGKIRTIITRKTLYKDPEGNKYLVGVINVITELKLAYDVLKQYRNNLENLVQERTKDIEEKNEKLVKFNKLFVDREFRIKELKDRIKELEG